MSAFPPRVAALVIVVAENISAESHRQRAFGHVTTLSLAVVPSSSVQRASFSNSFAAPAFLPHQRDFRPSDSGCSDWVVPQRPGLFGHDRPPPEVDRLAGCDRYRRSTRIRYRLRWVIAFTRTVIISCKSTMINSTDSNTNRLYWFSRWKIVSGYVPVDAQTPVFGL